MQKWTLLLVWLRSSPPSPSPRHVVLHKPPLQPVCILGSVLFGLSSPPRWNLLGRKQMHSIATQVCRDINSVQIPAHLPTYLHGASLSRTRLSQNLGRSFDSSALLRFGAFFSCSCSSASELQSSFLEKGSFGCCFLPQ